MILESGLRNISAKPSIVDAIVLQGVANAPILELVGSKKIGGALHSWITDRYRQPTDNANSEVSGLTEATTSTKQKNSNACQIIKNEFGVSIRGQEVAQYGDKELPYQTQKVAKEHIRDIEYAMLGLHNTTVFDVYNTGATPKMAGVFYYIPTAHKKDFGNTALDYDKLAQIIQPIWELGGVDDEEFVCLLGTTLKSKVNAMLDSSPFMRVNVTDKTYDPRVTRVATDFGIIKLVTHRLFNNPKLNNKVLVGNFNYAKLCNFTETKLTDVPTDKTATYKRYYTDCTLEVSNNDYFACGDNLI